jgi:hypothetical protein
MQPHDDAHPAQRLSANNESLGDALTSLAQLDEHLNRLENLLVLNRELQVIKSRVARPGIRQAVRQQKLHEARPGDSVDGNSTSVDSGSALDLTEISALLLKGRGPLVEESGARCSPILTAGRGVESVHKGTRKGCFNAPLTLREAQGEGNDLTAIPGLSVGLADAAAPAEVTATLSDLSATLQQRLPELRRRMNDLDRCAALTL